MKKILSLLASIIVVSSAVSAMAYAQEYEKCPSASEFASSEEWQKEISNGIKDGRYFADFDGNGTFNPVDAEILLYYYSEVSTLSAGKTIDDIDWSGATLPVPFDEDYCGSFFDGYDVIEWAGQTAVSVPLNNEILANVQKYGDITGDGLVMVNDAAALTSAYYNGFEIGDVNTDNKIDATDASCVLHYYASISTNHAVDNYTEQAMSILGDVNGDGFVMSDDSAEILMMYSVSAVAE